MTDTTPGQRFASALQQAESSGDTGDLVGQFVEEAQLHRPEVEKRGSSSTDPSAFWGAYLAQFSSISTEFTRVRESEGLAVLEWTSQGTLSAGRDLEYHGVSILELADDGRVERFATYYDTAAFVVLPPASPAS